MFERRFVWVCDSDILSSSCGNSLHFFRLEEISCHCSVVCFLNTFISCCVWFCGHKEWGYWRARSDWRSEWSPVSASSIVLYFLHHFVRLLVTDTLRKCSWLELTMLSGSHTRTLDSALSLSLHVFVLLFLSHFFFPLLHFLSPSRSSSVALPLSFTATHSFSLTLGWQ